MKDKEKLIERIAALLPNASIKVLEFVYWYLIG